MEKKREEGRRASFHQNDASKYRSKHLTSDSTTARERNKERPKFLEPHVLSQRIKKLCDRDRLEDAVLLLKNSPLAAQNAPAWNTLILETLKVKRYKFAYALYTDVCRLNSFHSQDPSNES